MKTWLLQRLREPSTWRGIVWLCTAFGLTLDPLVWEYVVAIGMAVAGLLGVLLSDDYPLHKKELGSLDVNVSGNGDYGDSRGSDL